MDFAIGVLGALVGGFILGGLAFAGAVLVWFIYSVGVHAGWWKKIGIPKP